MAEMTAELPANLGGEGASRLSGFEVTVFTAIPGTSPAQFDPEAAQTRLRTIECGPLMRDAVIGVSAGATALPVKAAVRAIYTNGVRSPWTVTDQDVVDANTSPFVRHDEIGLSLDLNGHQVFYNETAPTEGMVEGDYWFDTTPVGDGTIRYTPYAFDGTVWVPMDKQVTVTSVLAAGVVGARELKTGVMTTANYAEVCPIDGVLLVKGICPNHGAQDGIPIAGAKLDYEGTALKVAPQNVQIGNFNLYQMVRQYEVWFYNLESTEAPSFSVAGQPDQPDANYAVIVTPIGSTGTPNINSFVVKSVSKTTTAVSITIFEAPGNGNSVRFNVAILRAP